MSEDEKEFRAWFGAQLMLEMEDRGITQTQLANKLGVSRVMVNQWCHGVRVPTLYRWTEVQRVFEEWGNG